MSNGYALYDYTAQQGDELNLREGQLLVVFEDLDADWCYAKYQDSTSDDQFLVPKAYVKVFSDDSWDDVPVENPSDTLRGWFKKYKSQDAQQNIFNMYTQGSQRINTLNESTDSPQSPQPPLSQQSSVASLNINQAPPAQKFWYDSITDETTRTNLLESMSKNEKMFQQSSYELLATEEDYINDLKTMDQVFRKPLLEHKTIKPDVVEKLFANLEEIISANEILLQELQKCRHETDNYLMKNVGNALLNSAHSFKCYTTYCCNHSVAISLIDKKTGQEQLMKIIQEYQENPECKGLMLSSFLIKPIQRICKYPLLLREMLKYCDESSVDYPSLVSARDEIEGVLSELNEQKRQAEDMEKLTQLAIKFKCEDEFEIAEWGRRLIFEGDVQAIENGKSAGERHLVLFNDILLLTKPILLNIGKEKFRVINQFPLTFVCINTENENLGETSFEMVKIAKTRYQKNISYIFDAGEDKARWVSEFEKLEVKRNVQLETVPQISQQESQLLQLLGSSSFSGDTYVDPMEAYKREQEEIFRAQRETMQRENPPPQQQQQFEELERKSTFLSEDLFKFNFFKGSESSGSTRPSITVVPSTDLLQRLENDHIKLIEPNGKPAPKQPLPIKPQITPSQTSSPSKKPPIPQRSYLSNQPPIPQRNYAKTTQSQPQPQSQPQSQSQPQPQSRSQPQPQPSPPPKSSQVLNSQHPSQARLNQISQSHVPIVMKQQQTQNQTQTQTQIQISNPKPSPTILQKPTNFPPPVPQPRVQSMPSQLETQGQKPTSQPPPPRKPQFPLPQPTSSTNVTLPKPNPNPNPNPALGTQNQNGDVKKKPEIPQRNYQRKSTTT